MHIARIGRRSWRVRLGYGVLYAVLIAGALTTCYPFLLMLSTATKSHSDYDEYTPGALVPRYWRDERALYIKYLEDRYANNLDELNAAHDDAEYNRLKDAPAPVSAETTLAGTQRAWIDDWERFTESLPLDRRRAGFGEHENAPSRLLLRFRQQLRADYPGVQALNTAWGEENVSFDAVVPPLERTASRTFSLDPGRPRVRYWLDFKKTLPRPFLLTQPTDALYRKFLREDIYEADLKRLGAAWNRPVGGWREITLARRAPGDGSRKDWEAFVRTKLPLRMVGVDAAAEPAWRAFRKRRGRTDTPLPAEPPAGGLDRTDWMEFVAKEAPPAALSAETPENLWRAHLARAFGTVGAANAVFGTDWSTFAQARPPQALADLAYVRQNAGELRREFAGRNFRAVAGYLLVNGRAAANTVAFCLLSILTALLVNPMCAYALSRYNLPYAYQVLLFLLATMAFPAEVAMIPNFLMLRDLGMLNTFWALILPGVANGYSIFLLKGFFDSLPRELYEAGILDGAGEWTLFRNITAPLSLPIFSVIALNAFTGAYGAFLFALVVCQDPRMWTLMVYLYNLQATAPQYVIMAALTLSALPILIVFLAAQKVILRGIVLPSFK